MKFIFDDRVSRPVVFVALQVFEQVDRIHPHRDEFSVTERFVLLLISFQITTMPFSIFLMQRKFCISSSGAGGNEDFGKNHLNGII
jgi:hypothetical protein